MCRETAMPSLATRRQPSVFAIHSEKDWEQTTSSAWPLRSMKTFMEWKPTASSETPSNRHSGCKVPWHCSALSVRATTCVTGWMTSLIGDNLYTEGGYQPYTGRWLDKKANGSLQAKDADCLLNNGRKHDLYLIPTETACSVTINIRINGKRPCVAHHAATLDGRGA